MKLLPASVTLLAALDGTRAGDLEVFRKLEGGGRASIVAYGTSLTEAGRCVDTLRETLGLAPAPYDNTRAK